MLFVWKVIIEAFCMVFGIIIAGNILSAIFNRNKNEEE